jgi:hypothetical protein
LLELRNRPYLHLDERDGFSLYLSGYPRPFYTNTNDRKPNCSHFTKLEPHLGPDAHDLLPTRRFCCHKHPCFSYKCSAGLKHNERASRQTSAKQHPSSIRDLCITNYGQYRQITALDSNVHCVKSANLRERLSHTSLSTPFDLSLSWKNRRANSPFAAFSIRNVS